MCLVKLYDMLFFHWVSALCNQLDGMVTCWLGQSKMHDDVCTLMPQQQPGTEKAVWFTDPAQPYKFMCI